VAVFQVALQLSSSSSSSRLLACFAMACLDLCCRLIWLLLVLVLTCLCSLYTEGGILCLMFGCIHHPAYLFDVPGCVRACRDRDGIDCLERPDSGLLVRMRNG
jgi:hypothetical protein